MKTTTYLSMLDDGFIVGVAPSYDETRDAKTGVVNPDGETERMGIGQHFSVTVAGYHVIDRGFLFFDTREATMPEGTTVKLITKVSLRQVKQDFDLVVQRPIAPAYPKRPLSGDDFDRSHYTGNGGSINTASIELGDIEIPIDPSFINAGGITALILRSSHDIEGINPDSGTIGIRTREYANTFPSYEHLFAPRLVISEPTLKYDLTIDATTGGTTSPTPATYSHDEGSIVTVTAIPDTGYDLDHWELDGANVGSAISYDVTMDSHHLLTAIFIETGEEPPPAEPSTMPILLIALIIVAALIIVLGGERS